MPAVVVLTALILCFPSLAQEEAEPGENQLLFEALQATRDGDWDKALSLAGRVVEKAPRNPTAYLIRGQAYDYKRDFEKALKDYSLVLAMDPRLPDVLNLRGALQFRQGNIEASIEDFTRAIQLQPDSEPHHWQRGISYYLAGRYAEGKRQFELHQTVNPSDVENAVWHMLCNARLVGVEKARGSMFVVIGDRRVPMKQIYRLFKGEGNVDEVFDAVHVGDPIEQELKTRLFHAHVYSGLYHELIRSRKWAQEHLTRASRDYGGDHYMWEVARVHAELYQRGKRR